MGIFLYDLSDLTINNGMFILVSVRKTIVHAGMTQSRGSDVQFSHLTRSGKYRTTIPIGSMYGIYANIWGILMVNVTIYTIHGSYGIQRSLSAIGLLMSTCRIRACFASNNDSPKMLPKIG